MALRPSRPSTSSSGEVLARRGGADLRVVEPVRRAGLELLAERDHVEVREHEALVGVHEHAGPARLLAEPAGADVDRARAGPGHDVVGDRARPAGAVGGAVTAAVARERQHAHSYRHEQRGRGHGHPDPAGSPRVPEAVQRRARQPAAPGGRLRRRALGERLERGLGILLGVDALVVGHAGRRYPERAAREPAGSLARPVALGSFIGVGRSLDSALRRVASAEELGYESVFVTHIGGRDSITLLAAYAAATSRMRLGTGVIPIYARTPANMAQSFATLDDISGGRAIAGLGVSHKPVVEHWFGQSIDKPLAEMREYVAIVRAILRGEDPPPGEKFRTAFHLIGWDPRDRTCRSTSPASPPAC